MTRFLCRLARLKETQRRPPDTPGIVARCSCGRGYTAAEFDELPNRKPWIDAELELARCTACAKPGKTATTITRPIKIVYRDNGSIFYHGLVR